MASHRSRQHGLKQTHSDGEEDDEDFDDDEDFFEEDEFDDEFGDDDHDDDVDEDDDDDVIDSIYKVRPTLRSKSKPNQLTDAVVDDCSLDSSSDISDIHVPTMSTSAESRYVSKQYTCSRDHRHRPTNQEFDVRMIDFAHTSFSSNTSSDGFILGLENLIRLLTDIRHGKSSTTINSKKRRRSSNMEHLKLASNINKKKSDTSSRCCNKQMTNDTINCTIQPTPPTELIPNDNYNKT